MGSNQSISNRYNNCRVQGNGGSLKKISGKVHAVVVSFDYENPDCLAKSACSELTSTRDGKNFVGLCEKCKQNGKTIHVTKFFDTEGPYPEKDVVKRAIRRAATLLGPDDLFTFYFAGHGTQLKGASRNKDDKMDEALCFVKPDGSPDWLIDDELADLLLEFHPKTHILVITDCCHAGSVGDLDRPKLNGRPIIHMGAIEDKQEAINLGEGGAFTSALMDIIGMMVKENIVDVSAAHVFNAMYGRFEAEVQKDNQTFTFAHPPLHDPDTFRWPLVPPPGWEASTIFDKGKGPGIFKTQSGGVAPYPISVPLVRSFKCTSSSQRPPIATVRSFSAPRQRPHHGSMQLPLATMPLQRPTPMPIAQPRVASVPSSPVVCLRDVSPAPTMQFARSGAYSPVPPSPRVVRDVSAPLRSGYSTPVPSSPLIYTRDVSVTRQSAQPAFAYSPQPVVCNPTPRAPSPAACSRNVIARSASPAAPVFSTVTTQLGTVSQLDMSAQQPHLLTLQPPPRPPRVCVSAALTTPDALMKTMPCISVPMLVPEIQAKIVPCVSATISAPADDMIPMFTPQVPPPQRAPRSGVLTPQVVSWSAPVTRQQSAPVCKCGTCGQLVPHVTSVPTPCRVQLLPP